MAIAGTTVSTNSATDGGGNIYNCDPWRGAALTLNNCTLDSSDDVNDATFNRSATLIILNCTSWHESIGNLSGALSVGSTILSSTPLQNFAGTNTSLGYNLSSDGGGGYLTNTTDQINTDPMLGPLQDNGGPTFTHALLRGSPAIDKGKNLSASATDQLGQPRTYDHPAIPNAAGGDGTDIGAVEFIPPALAVARNSGNILLSWPTNDPGYTAESSAVLPNSGSWTLVPGTPQINGNLYFLADGLATSNKFYRLKAP